MDLIDKDLENMDRKDLQKYAKQIGISVSLSNKKLVQHLKYHVSSIKRNKYIDENHDVGNYDCCCNECMSHGNCWDCLEMSECPDKLILQAHLDEKYFNLIYDPPELFTDFTD